MTSALLICPPCLENGKKRVLGSVTTSGDFYIQKWHPKNGNGTTIIQASDYTVFCVCGFGTTIHSQASGKAVISYTQ